MTIQEVSALMGMNMVVYANSAKPLSDEIAAKQISIWASELADVPAYTGQQAMKKAFTVCKFPVTLADLFAQIRKIQAQYELPAGKIWPQILSNASRISYVGEKPVDYAELFSELPKVAQDWLGSYHAMRQLDRMSDEERSYKRREFERFYDIWMETAPLNPNLLPANEEQAAALATNRATALLPPTRKYAVLNGRPCDLHETPTVVGYADADGWMTKANGDKAQCQKIPGGGGIFLSPMIESRKDGT